MKTISSTALLLLFVFVLIGCSGISNIVSTEPTGASGEIVFDMPQEPTQEQMDPTITALIQEEEALTPGATYTPYVPGEVTPTAPNPYETGPRFIPSISFATQPDPSVARNIFPEGTQQIYAMWDYQDMSEGLTIRREWYHNNELWMVREEEWDYAKYGSDGTIMDVSVYDFDYGLEVGVYKLRLFINDREFIADDVYQQKFSIAQAEYIEPVTSPDETLKALVYIPGTLVIQRGDGSQEEILSVEEISSIAWHIDNIHVFYSVRDRSEQHPSLVTIGIQDELWAVNIQTGQQYQLTAANENMHHPLVSPDGKYLAGISGNGYADACMVDKRIIIIQIDQNLDRTAAYQISDFAGLQNIEYINPKILSWKTESSLEVELEWYCTENPPNGIYSLNLGSMQAVSPPVTPGEQLSPIPPASSPTISTLTIQEDVEIPNYTISIDFPFMEVWTAADQFNHAINSLINLMVAEFIQQVESIEDWRAKSMPDQGSSLKANYITYMSESVVSIVFNISSYSAGAAHELPYTKSMNFDLVQGQELSLSDLFIPGSNYLEEIANYCIQDLTAKGMLFYEDGAFATQENYARWNITNEGLLITFDSYQVAPYAAGPQRVTVPYDNLMNSIDPEGSLFRVINSN